MATQRDWIWFAGFLDADGCFGIYNGYPLVTITQTNREVIRYIRDLVGSGSITQTAYTTAGNPCWRIRWGSRTSRLIAAKVRPFLQRTDRQEKADDVIAWQPSAMEDRKNHRTQKPQYHNALALYREGLSCKEIARQLKLKAPTVNYWVRKAGITRDLKEAQQLRREREAGG